MMLDLKIAELKTEVNKCRELYARQERVIPNGENQATAYMNKIKAEDALAKYLASSQNRKSS